MYNVSENYKAAMKNAVQRVKISGTINGVNFSEQNILQGSLSINNQCSSGDLIEIGQVFIGELNCTFLSLDISRYEWYGAEIKISFGQGLDNGNYEYIPLGVYTISEAEYTASGVVVKAYDNISKLDKNCNAISTGATPYILARQACINCGVVLETTESEFRQFANYNVTLGVYAENDISTYRDVISWIAQLTGCFVTASRSGGIIFKTYGGDPVDTIDANHRFTGCSFSDFSTRYTGLSVVNIEQQTTSYYGLDIDNALTYNLGSNPYLQIPVSHSLTTMRRNVLNALANINYVPFKAVCIGNPAYDLGDVLLFTGGLADNNIKSCITKYTFNYGRNYTLECTGKNPALATAYSKSDKNISGLMNKASAESVYKCRVLRNGRAISINDGEASSVLFARYLIASPCHVRINMEVLLTLTTENEFAEIKAIYKADGIEITDRHPVETWKNGKHILTLQYDLDHDDSLAHTWDLWLECTGGNIEIEELGVYEVISSTGLAADSNWQGTFRDEDGNLYIVIDGVAHKIPDKIQINTYPVKIDYELDTPLDYTGLKVDAVYGDGTKIDITAECRLNPREGSPFDTDNDTYIEVYYTIWGVEYGTGFDLLYNYITEFLITPPDKVDYKYGEILDYTGVKVVAKYRDNTLKDITADCVFTPAEGGLFDYYTMKGV